jgi:hypothetical protein
VGRLDITTPDWRFLGFSMNSMQLIERPVVMTSSGVPASDGAGVRLTRMIGVPGLEQLDPFLLLDVFQTDKPDDYIAGFPPHPHRGFETVTYMFAGRMRHKDNAGNEGVIEAGGVQWMTAARGIVHSEMPEQEDGLMWGTQLWVNLPASQKMGPPGYQEFAAGHIPSETREAGVTVKVVAGRTSVGTIGAVRDRPTEPLYLDVQVPAGTALLERVPQSHAAMVFVVDGSITVQATTVNAGMLGVLGAGDAVRIEAVDRNSRLLLIAARPLNEPIARGGPFVMNTQQELRQAFYDYQSGRF